MYYITHDIGLYCLNTGPLTNMKFGGTGGWLPRYGETNGMFGKQHSTETKNKISKSKSGKKFPPEYGQKISKTMKQKPKSYYIKSLNAMKMANCKKIIQENILGIITEYDSIKNASIETGIPRTSISAVLCGRLEFTKDKSKWFYKSV